MNLPLREFWRRVREVESTLPSDVWLAPAEGGNLTPGCHSIYDHDGCGVVFDVNQ